MSVKGYVMQVQPFSVNDGDGIRTTIFLAGCPMHCKWCSNPEGMAEENKVGWYFRHCIGCGVCTQVCPSGIGIDMNKERDKCIACGSCVKVCPKRARSCLVSYRDADDLIKEVDRHGMFLRGSGGGVTFSGGEATTQYELLNYLSKRLYDKGYNLAIETCGFFDFEKVEESLKRMDLIFMDIKHMNEEKHRHFTGVSNAKILENVKKLNKVDSRVVIRIPVIGGVNNDEENIRATAKYVHKNLPKAEMEMLPYHTFGVIKYEALGLKKPENSFYRPDEFEMDRLRQILCEEGITVVDFR